MPPEERQFERDLKVALEESEQSSSGLGVVSSQLVTPGGDGEREEKQEEENMREEEEEKKGEAGWGGRRGEQGLEEGRYGLCCPSLFAGPVENDTSDSDEYVGDNSDTDDDDCHLDDAEDDDDEYAESKPPPQKRRATKAPTGGKTRKGKGVPPLAWCWLMYVAKHRMSNSHPMSSWTITLHILGTC